MTVIMASTVGVRTMADGSMRLTVEIEPGDAIKAFTLFGSPGHSVALARITSEAATKALQGIQTNSTADISAAILEKAKGGPLAKLAGMWCNDLRFHEWLRVVHEVQVYTPDAAANIVREWCGIGSRAELDSNEAAAHNFHGFIREPFAEYLRSLE